MTGGAVVYDATIEGLSDAAEFKSPLDTYNINWF